MKRQTLILISIIMTIQFNLWAQSSLTLEQIFKTKEYDARDFGRVQWLDNGKAYTPTDRKKYQSKDIIEFDTETGMKKTVLESKYLVPAGRKDTLAVYSYQWSADKKYLLVFTNTKKVWRYHTRGDYWIFDTKSQKLWQLGDSFAPSGLMFATFSPDSRQIVYVYKNNIYMQNLTDRSLIQLTHDGSETIINGTFDWVYEEEFHLRNGLRWSPDSKMISFWQLDADSVGTFYMINNTDSVYARIIPIPYPKAGTTNSACRIGVINLENRKIKFLDLSGNPRQHYIAWMEWIPGTRSILFQRLNRLQNTIWLTRWNPDEDDVKIILIEKDEAWLDVVTDIKWITNNKFFTWISERDGWRHLYLVSVDGSDITCLTPGEFDIIKFKHIDDHSGNFYYTASPDNPTCRYLYRGNFKENAGLQRVSPLDQEGTHTYDFSPDGGYAIHTFSSFNVPPVIDLVRLPEHSVVRTMVDNAVLRDKIEHLLLGEREFFRIDIGDGVELDGWTIFPPSFDPQKKYPVLFHVYGEPWNQTVLDRWFGSEHVWHLLLSQKGYIIMSVDNRGTPAPRGRDWRKIVYGQIGILASQDQAAAVRALIKEREYIDPGRIAIWGWSGGGSMSLNAIFRYPDLYHTAMSVAPVSNQLYYDTIYQERYMGLPQDNPDGYKYGSPITYAGNLQGNLLIVHGTGDDNVHYQSTEAVVNELIRHNKKFTMMAYPNRTHSIKRGENTSLHLRELLTRFLMDNMPVD